MEIGFSFGQTAQPRGFNSWVWTSVFHPALTLTCWVTLGGKETLQTHFNTVPTKGTTSFNAYKDHEMSLFKGKKGLCIPHPSGEENIPPSQQQLVELWHLMAPN